MDRKNRTLIKLENVSKIYNPGVSEVFALNNINLEVKTGEFTAVTGKSGSGKSTLLNMITGIDLPSKGDVILNGRGINTLSENKRAVIRGKNLGIVFQFFQLIPTLSILDNILLPMDLVNEIPYKERIKRGKELLRLVGIEDQGAKLPANLSGGQQQRAAIARALANDPPLIVADEPTGNLDSHTAENIFSIFANLVEQGKTILIITHEKDIEERVSRVITLKDGQLIRDDRTKEYLYA